ncbi:MAG TPA: hypothetical protein PLZ12_12645 [Saprospiraceae bacterium]|nr:hypothetical protein [Saprospiraceae bacterium]
MLKNVTVVIRSSGERTTELSYHLANKEVPPQAITIINETPFYNAVIKTFEIGKDVGRKWTLALDADILLRTNAISDLVNLAEGLPDHFFMIQGRVLDKLFCFSRNGGPHLFRTELIDIALPLVPTDSKVLRPEGETVRRMIELGYHRYKGADVYGIHDFEQYNHDIYKTAFIHAIKFKRYVPYFIDEWNSRTSFDIQYKIALAALKFSANTSNTTSLTRSDIIESYEKWAITESIIDVPYLQLNLEYNIDNIMSFFKVSKSGNSIEQKEHATISRTDIPPPKAKPLCWHVKKMIKIALYIPFTYIKSIFTKNDY